MVAAPRFRDGTDPTAVVDTLREHGAVLVDEMIDGATVAAINREVDAAVAAAEPGSKTVNEATQAFFGPHTKHVSSLAAVSPTFANEVMTHPTYLAVCDEILLPQCSRYRLNLGHLIVRGPGAQAQIPHRDEDVWPHFPARTPTSRSPRSRPRRLPRRKRRHARRARKPSLGPQPPARARRDRRRVVPPVARSSTSGPPSTRGHELDRRRVATRAAPQLHARLAAHRGEQRARRPAAIAKTLTPEAQALLGYAVHDAIADGGGYLGMVRMATRWSCSRPASWSRRATRAASSLSSPPACACAGVILLRD